MENDMKKPYSPNYRRPPRPEPAVVLDFELDGEYVLLPLDCRPCDLLVTWAEARREATS
jgi:hypothetical protein